MSGYSSLDGVPPHVREKIGRFFSNVGGRTFVIRNLPLETVGAGLARYSRASSGIQLTFVNEFLDEEGNLSQEHGTEVLERILIGFGDDSVGELAGTHVGIEDASQLLTKAVEDHRLGSYIEQSSRYVRYDRKDAHGRWRYLKPKEVVEAGLLPKFEQVNDRVFEVYARAVDRLIDYFERELPRERYEVEITRSGKKRLTREAHLENEEERRAFSNAYRFTIRCAALDVARGLLPSSTLTHFGVFANGRTLTTILNSLKNSELHEMQERASELEEELNKEIPTFIRRNAEDPRVRERDKRLSHLAEELFRGEKPKIQAVTLVEKPRSYGSELFDEFLVAVLFPYTSLSLPQIQKVARKLDPEKRLQIINAYNMGGRRDKRDRTGRALEVGYPFTFDLVGTFGEFRDLHRHRMLTQQRQKLGIDLGFVIVPEMIAVGLEQEIRETVGMMEDLHQDLLCISKEVAQYATMYNHRIRWMMSMNGRELQHLTELRSGPKGHPGYRAMVMEMARQALERERWLESAQVLAYVDYSDPENKITRAAEQARIAGKSLERGLDSGIDLQ